MISNHIAFSVAIFLLLLWVIEKFFDLKKLRLRTKILWAGAIFIIACITIMIEHDEKVKNQIDSNKIYLSLFETGAESPLYKNGIVVHPINEIKENMSATLRFALRQNNFKAPQITKILITFPADALVECEDYRGWRWERNLDKELTYFLSYFDREPCIRGSPHTLPVFKVVFKKLDLLKFSYKINGIGFEMKDRTFIIDPILSNRIVRESSPHTSVGLMDNGVNSATPSIVINGTVSPESKLKYRAEE